jgi:3-deoxy-D-manno-octulosonate 8-phosphate phosphatase (KDO 8-P phosphatase)
MNRNLRAEAQKHFEKLKKIKAALFDVDGILTDGHLYYDGAEVGFNRSFHAHDGYGLKVLMKAGLHVGIITGGDSLGVKMRFEQLGIPHLYMGNEDKRVAYEQIKQKLSLKDEEILYMGDEFFDLPLLNKAGFSATVPNASLEVQEAVDYVTERQSGKACAREVIDMLRYAQNIIPHVDAF